jgi:hypothetical protein
MGAIQLVFYQTVLDSLVEFDSRVVTYPTMVVDFADRAARWWQHCCGGSGAGV